MKWKVDTAVKWEEGYTFFRDDGSRKAAKEDDYLIDAIEKGMTDDNELLALIMAQEGTDEVVSGFRLAQFILDYVDYISNDVGHTIIKP